MFGHSTFAERPLGSTDVGSYDLTQKVFSFDINQTQEHQITADTERPFGIYHVHTISTTFTAGSVFGPNFFAFDGEYYLVTAVVPNNPSTTTVTSNNGISFVKINEFYDTESNVGVSVWGGFASTTAFGRITVGGGNLVSILDRVAKASVGSTVIQSSALVASGSTTLAPFQQNSRTFLAGTTFTSSPTLESGYIGLGSDINFGTGYRVFSAWLDGEDQTPSYGGGGFNTTYGIIALEIQEAGVNTGWLNPTAFDVFTAAPFTNSGAVLVDDGVFATATVASGTTGTVAAIGVRGFNASIPVGATIDGVEIRFRGRQTVVNAGIAWSGLLTTNTQQFVAGTSNHITSQNAPARNDVGTTLANYSFGSTSGWASNVWGNFTDDEGVTYTYSPTVDDINLSTFGTAFVVTSTGGVNTTVSLDQIQMRVWYTPAPLETLFQFSYSLASETSGAVRRNRRVTGSVLQSVDIIEQLRRARAVPFSFVEAETLTASTRRDRRLSLSISAASSTVAALVRARRVSTSVLSEIDFVIDSIGTPLTLFSLFVDQAVDATFNVLRSRRVQLSAAEIEAVVITSINRVRRTSLSMAQVETINTTVGRRRGMSAQVQETEAITSAVGVLRGIALSLAESFDYSFDLAKIKLLTAAIVEVENLSFGALRRTRRVAETIDEVVQYALSVNRGRRVPFTVTQTEAITEAIRRLRDVRAQLNEAEAITLAVGRRRAVQTAVSAVETVTMSLAKLKLMAFVSQQTSDSVYFLNRARAAVVSIETLEAVQASFNCARALVSVNESTQDMSLDFARIREQVIAISETQGVDVALGRIRELLQSISNATDLQFNVDVFKGDPASLTVNVSWLSWSAQPTTGGAVLRQVVNRESLFVPIRVTGSATVVESMSQTVIVPLNSL